MSQTIRIDEPGFFNLLIKWGKENFLLPSLTLSIQIIAIPFISEIPTFFLSYIVQTILIYAVPWIVILVCFWFKIWRFHVVITNWYGVFRNKDYFNHLILSSIDISNLVIFVRFGPAVRNWIARFTIHKDCRLVDFHNQAHWVKGYNKDKGLVCLSSSISDHDFNLKYDLQTRKNHPDTPTTEVTLEIMTNVDESDMPSNYSLCKRLTNKKGSYYFKRDFIAILIPIDN